MKIYDVFPFFNEIDLLEIRLNTLDDIVDTFIITEASETHSGIEKPYYLSLSMEKFQKFSHKIIIQKVSKFPNNLTGFERDRYQRDQVKKILENKLSDDDILIYGDVDEIPNISALEKAIKLVSSDRTKIAHLAQDIFYCYLNQKEVSGTLHSYTGEYGFRLRRKWLGTNVSKWKYSKNFTITDLRDPMHKKYGVRIGGGGSHFSYIGSEGGLSVDERVNKKMASSAHEEFNTEIYLSKLQSRISDAKDIFGRKRSRYKVVHDLSYLPPYVLANLGQFQSLIKRKVGSQGFDSDLVG